jgi:hypothetical protein
VATTEYRDAPTTAEEKASAGHDRGEGGRLGVRATTEEEPSAGHGGGGGRHGPRRWRRSPARRLSLARGGRWEKMKEEKRGELGLEMKLMSLYMKG